jgi:putative phosphoribosyl transferase
MPQRFRDRREAGRKLAERLSSYAGQADSIVLALPRGGVPVGYEIARALNIELDVFLVRKLGAPGREELAMGAIASGGIRVLNEEVVSSLGIAPETIDRVAAEEAQELERRSRAYRAARPPLDLRSRTVILVDDGLATGSTMRAAVEAVRSQSPRRIVVAVPTASPEVCADFESRVDQVVCLITPEFFYAVGLWYENFDQTADHEVKALLDLAWRASSK